MVVRLLKARALFFVKMLQVQKVLWLIYNAQLQSFFNYKK
jgi:hypothetical protein